MVSFLRNFKRQIQSQEPEKEIDLRPPNKTGLTVDFPHLNLMGLPITTYEGILAKTIKSRGREWKAWQINLHKKRRSKHDKDNSK